MNEQNIRNIDRRAELTNCNFVKTMLMVLVVFYHSILFWNGSWFTGNPVTVSSALSTVAAWLNSFHVYGFALVSGYVFSYLRLEKGKYSQFGMFIENKVYRLLIPYVFIALFWVIPIQYLFFKSNWSELFYKYGLATSPSQLWFLVMLFDVFVISWLLSDFWAKHDLRGMMSAIGFAGLGIIGGAVLPNVFMIWTTCQYVPLFWLGFKLRQHGSEMIRRIPVILWLIVDLILFAVVQYLGDTDILLLKLIKIGANFVLHIVGALMVFIALQKLAEKITWDNGVFAILCKNSMIIYLLHQQVIYFMIYWLNGKVSVGIHVVINFVGAMGISLLMAMFLMRFRVTRFLVGEK